MTTRLELAAVQLAAKLHEKTPHRAELAALEAALRTAAIEREDLDDLPRMIELEKHTAPDSDYTAGWNAALELAASLARFVLRKGRT